MKIDQNWTSMPGISYLPGSFCPQAPQSILCREEELEPMGKDVAHTASFTWVSWNIKPPHKKSVYFSRRTQFPSSTWFEGHDWSRDQGRHGDNHPAGSSEKENIKRRWRKLKEQNLPFPDVLLPGSPSAAAIMCSTSQVDALDLACIVCRFLIYNFFYAIIMMSS